MEPQAKSPDRNDPGREERRARVVPLEFGKSLLGHWSYDPVSLRQARDWTALWEWLSDLMLYEARDLHGLSFHIEAARGYNPPGRVSVVPEVRLAFDPSALTLTSRDRSATVKLQLSSSTASPSVGIRFATPTGESPTLRPEFGRLEGASRAPDELGWTYALQPATPNSPRLSLPVHVERPDSSRSLDPAFSGCLVQYRLASWTFTSALPITMPSDPELFRVLLGEAQGEAFGGLLVRPGTGPTPLPVRVWNPTSTPRTIVVELRVGETGSPVLSLKEVVKAGAIQPVSFPPGPLPQGVLPSLTIALRFRVRDADQPGLILGEQEVRVGVLPVMRYVQVVEVLYTPPRVVVGDPNRLAVRVRSRAMDAGPPCPVELVLSPGRIPGFLTAGSGLFRGELPADGNEMTLFAEAMRFEEGVDGVGTVSLNIDGVPRAQSFHVRFSPEGGPRIAEWAVETDVRLRMPKAVRSGDPLEVVAEVDNAADDATLELSLGRADHGPFEPMVTRRFDRPRQSRVGFLATSPGGSPLVEASLQDWSVRFPTAGIHGTYEVRARLRDVAGRRVDSASQPVIIDDAPPRWVILARLPKQAKRGTPLKVRAAGEVPASGIREVVFFVGKPAPDGKLPAGAPTATGRLTPGNMKTWDGTLPLPAEIKGPIEVSVQFVSNVGLTSFDTGSLELIDTDPIPTGSIRGRVREGELPQAGLDVVLVNAKGEKLETKTNADGIFSFTDVPVGKYIVGCIKPTSKRTGRLEVEVKADVTSKAEVELFYQ